HCLNLARDRYREATQHRPMTEENTRGDYEDSFPSGFDMEGWYRSRILREAIERLSDKLRVVIVLHYYSDYSVKEIAAVLDLPVRTVYSRLEMAKARLGKDLKGWLR